MVLRPARRGPQRNTVIRNVVVFLVCMATSYTAMRFILGQTLTEFVQQNVIPAITKEDRAEFIDMQDIVDDFVAGQKGQAGVMIYDLDNDRLSAIYNSDTVMQTASLYKLMPVYENYLRMETGEFARGDVLVSEYRNGKTERLTRETCAVLAIRESNSACAEAMVKEIGQEELDEITQKDYDMQKTEGLTSTAGDMMKMLKLYWEHEDFSNETWEKIKDSMLNQPATKEGSTTNDWRQGLPSGFVVATVYNKVGWQADEKDKSKWAVYNDAAIVEFAEQKRHFIVVVMSSNIEPSAIASLGSKIEQRVLSS